jgi:hypothetical protein
MATSSLFKKFVIEDEKEAEAFWATLEKSEKESADHPIPPTPVQKADRDWIEKNL